MMQFLPLFAQSSSRTVFEWGRIQSNTDWILPVVVLAALLLFSRLLYRRDSVELPGWLSWLLTAMRWGGIVALWLVYLQPQLRSEREIVFNSHALVLADVSSSMGMSDGGSSTQGTSRADESVRALAQTGLLEALRRRHDVVIWKFSESADPVVRLNRLPRPSSVPAPAAGSSDDEASALDWSVMLAPTGTETRLGASLYGLLEEHLAAPVSGVIVLTDGGQNAGDGPSAAVKLAQELQIPIHTIGIGSPERPSNIRVRDLAAPSRAYPGDPYTVTGYLQSSGFDGQTMTVELWSSPGDSGGSAGEEAQRRLEATDTVTMRPDGDVVPVTFELTPGEIGRRTLKLLVKTPANDTNASDDSQQVDVEIVDRKTRVLLFAGGPTREYRFVRIQLFRDKSVTLDVYLQTGAPGISQEADAILDHFPSTREALFAYDAVVAFDPDWQALSTEQVDVLETWVAEQAGGLIVVCGPVYTDRWTQSAAMNKVRGLYPVEFNRRFRPLDGRYSATEPWPIEFTREGLESEFLWLDDSPSRSAQTWAGFPGVYGYHAVRRAKAGATVYGRFSDPRSGEGDELPAYMAGQFYGSGRVFYLGSGEMWRLRGVDPAHFERFYTQLIRHVSQGRLLRGSTRGLLLVQRDRYLLGQTVDVQAQLSDAQLQPLEAANVELEVVAPDGTLETLVLNANVNRLGAFSGQFTTRLQGTYRLELPVPESDAERLVRRIQVNVPELEQQRPERNDVLLARIASETGGQFYRGVDEALGTDDTSAVATLLKDRSRIDLQIGKPQPLWDKLWVMLTICGLFSLEWLIRRLVRLA